MSNFSPKSLPKITLDRTDRRILDELQKDGAISNLDLAEKVGLSPSPCSRRVKALQESGIIQKTVAVLDPKSFGLDLMAMISISMDRHTPERFENFEAIVSGFPEVLECYIITGSSADYLLKVVVKDMEGYHQFLLGKLTRIEGVSGVHSSFVMRKVVDSTRLPLN
ncbi:Transcriptional regulator, AsnC/Lrp family protein [Oleispira antarctica RB-8]|uniref:Transcriptional regulator, AsnC/Lrp family protein n=1 Tax=Oleispira antarctica RB-8 TaxID=698738 RepID=R4YSK9_OLEAN|nr:Transcriptional regulator, AsnC/Lrp family protein [Oleispira antarctica RB-8]|tara:strand:+ start:4089 stop:4586 length:498 start_codon:yes stop_codon:yes gene_type:complete